MFKVRVLLFREEGGRGMEQIYKVNTREEAMAIKELYEIGAETYKNTILVQIQELKG